MARNRVADKQKEKQEQKERERLHFAPGEWEITRATELKDGTIFFDLKILGIQFYSLSIVAGKNGDFISEPSRKGKDGKYYKYYYLNLDEETADAIMDTAAEIAADN